MPRPLVCDLGASSTRCTCTVHTELVWDGANTATAITQNGQSLSVGDDWTPEVLFSLGVESSLMTTFLRLANEASLPVLAYVSAGQLVALEDDGCRLIVSVCIVVENSAAEVIAEEIWQEARGTAPLAAMLSSQLNVEAAVTVVGAGAPYVEGVRRSPRVEP